jgi:hypothetical protein
MRQKLTDTVTTGAVAWTITVNDPVDCMSITINFDTAPTSAGSITVTRDDAAGSDYDTVLVSVNPVGSTDVVIKDVDKLLGKMDAIDGVRAKTTPDQLLVSYANPDNRTIFATANMETVQ